MDAAVLDLTIGVWTVAPVLANSVKYVVFDNLGMANEQVDEWVKFFLIIHQNGHGGEQAGQTSPCRIVTVTAGASRSYMDSHSDLTGGIAFYDGSTGGVVAGCRAGRRPERRVRGIRLSGGAVDPGKHHQERAEQHPGHPSGNRCQRRPNFQRDVSPRYPSKRRERNPTRRAAEAFLTTSCTMHCPGPSPCISVRVVRSWQHAIGLQQHRLEWGRQFLARWARSIRTPWLTNCSQIN